MKRVGLITYWYPPNQSIASIRLAKLVKYLPDFGWEPLVITVAPGSDLYQRAGPLPDERRAGQVYRTRDLSLGVWAYRVLRWLRGQRVAAQPDGAAPVAFYGARQPLVRAAYWLYRQALCFPDECWPWLWEYPAVRAIVAREKPDALYSSSLPATTHLLASRLAQELRLPWVAELRDFWSESYTLRRIAPLRWLEARLERATLRPARVLVTVSEPLRERLAERHRKPAHIVMNGFDDADFAARPAPAAGPAPAFTLVYTGTVYPGKQDPGLLFQALSALRRAGRSEQPPMEVLFYSRSLGAVRAALETYPDLRGSVRLVGEVTHAEALRAQQSAAALLFLEWTDAGDRGVLTGKLFEYLAAGRPILACGPAGGAVEPVLRATGAGELASTPEAIQAVLLRWLDEFRRTGAVRVSVPPEKLQPYTRRHQAGQLAGILESVVS